MIDFEEWKKEWKQSEDYIEWKSEEDFQAWWKENEKKLRQENYEKSKSIPMVNKSVIYWHDINEDFKPEDGAPILLQAFEEEIYSLPGYYQHNYFYFDNGGDDEKITDLNTNNGVVFAWAYYPFDNREPQYNTEV